MLRTTGLVAVMLIGLITLSFAQGSEQITITTYYPSPFGNYRELVVTERMAIGDVNRDGQTNTNDLALDPWNADQPLMGSIVAADRIGIGTVRPLTRLHVMSSMSPLGTADITMLLQATDRLASKGGPLGLGNRSPALSYAESDGTPIGALGMAGFANAWTSGSRAGDLVLTGGRNRGNRILIGTAPQTPAPGTLSTARVVVEPDGNVGIGGHAVILGVSTMPVAQSLLDVRGPVGGNEIRIENTDNGRFSLLGHDATGAYFRLSNPTDDTWSFRGTGGTEVVTIDPDSERVGIGKTNPGAKLDVDGGIKVGRDNRTCNAGRAGIMRYNAGAMEYCDGTDWRGFGGVAFGNWVLLASNVGPDISGGPMATDGLILAYTTIENHLEAFTDANNPPVTKRIQHNVSSSGVGVSLVTMPVKKGDRWRLRSTYAGGIAQIWWLPLQ